MISEKTPGPIAKGISWGAPPTPASFVRQVRSAGGQEKERKHEREEKVIVTIVGWRAREKRVLGCLTKTMIVQGWLASGTLQYMMAVDRGG